jgi:cobalamin biosynthesis protein CobW
MKIPVTIFTGFLGAGKTTIICTTLRQCPERKFAVVVNEFGSISIDGPLIAKTDEHGNIEVSNVTGGLIAYSTDDQFDKVLAELGARGAELDHLIIETSGLAVPTAIIERLALASGKFALDAIIAIVDTPVLVSNDAQSSAAQSVFKSQLDAADIVVLNKIDSMSSADQLKAEQILRNISPRVRFIELAREGRLDANLLLAVHLHTTKHMQAVGMVLTGSGHDNADGHSHAGWEPHVHGLHSHQHIHEHDPGWLSFSLHCHEPQVPERLVHAIEEVTSKQAVFRAKGFFRTKERQIFQLQCVQNRVVVQAPEHSNDQAKEQLQPQHDHHHVEHHHQHNGEHHHTGEQDNSEIVFIGYNILRDEVASALQLITNTQWH